MYYFAHFVVILSFFFFSFFLYEKGKQKLNPLYLLRSFVTNNKLSEIKEDGEDIVFGDVLRVKATTNTIYKNKEAQGTQGVDYVTIISALLVAKYVHRFKYVSEMGKVNIPSTMTVYVEYIYTFRLYIFCLCKLLYLVSFFLKTFLIFSLKPSRENCQIL